MYFLFLCVIINKKKIKDIVMRKKLLKLSGISAIISVFIFGFNYYFFHFVTDDGFTLVADLIGQLGVHFLFFSLATMLVALICFKKGEDVA